MYCKNCGKEIKDGSVFCTYCGTRVEAENPQEPVKLHEEARKSDDYRSEEIDYRETFREVVGKNADYYLAQEDRLQKGEKDKMNWASFFLSMLHAGYRNMWKTRLKKMWIPLLLSLVGTTLGQILLFIQPAASMVLNLISGIGSIWLLVAQILYAKKFNRMYLEHVKNKVEHHDKKPDVSVGRAVVIAVIFAIIAGVLGAISSAGMMMGLFGGMDNESDDMYDSSSEIEERYDTYENGSETGDSEGQLVEVLPYNIESGTNLESSTGESTSELPDYSVWLGDYQRTRGPACSVSVWEADENGLLFVANIGYSGADAYVDMRDCIASWIDESTAVYQEGDYEITFTCTDGTLYLTENMPEPYGSLSIAGEYVPIEEAVYPDCEYVFPFSSEYEVMEVDCDGLTAEECRIAKNEIYARHGRMFDDPLLQNYFDSCSWYTPSIASEDFTEDMLSETERASIWGIEAYEGYMGYR